ncbi:MAG: hypothetical protein GDA56_07455 [Hormoscilla sp. GM7CHS1pb]|nr:hypothetical protein [Hormoscilla sp. GM7CHS1pb]
MNSTKTMPVLPVEAYTSQEWFDKEPISGCADSNSMYLLSGSIISLGRG